MEQAGSFEILAGFSFALIGFACVVVALGLYHFFVLTTSGGGWGVGGALGKASNVGPRSAPGAVEMVIEIDLTLDDYRAYVRFAGRYAKAAVTRRKSLLDARFLIGVALGLIGFGVLSGRSSIEIHWPSVAVMSALFVAFVVLVLYSLNESQKALAPRPDGCILGAATLSFSEDGVSIRSTHHETIVRWSGVEALCDEGDQLFLMIDPCAGYTIPKRCLPPGVSADELQRIVSAHTS